MSESMFFNLSSEEPTHKEKISADDKRLREIIGRNQDAETRHVFGLAEIRTMVDIERESEGREPDVKILGENWIESILQQSKYQLATLATDPKNPLADVGFEGFLHEVYKDPSVQESLRSLFPQEIFEVEGMGTMFEVKTIAEKMQDIPSPAYRRMLEIHVAEHAEKQRILEENLPDLQERMRTVVRQAIDRRLLPITEAFVEQRINDTKAVAGDFVLYADTTQLRGDYDASNDVVVITLDEYRVAMPDDRAEKSLADRREAIYVHEMLHSLSGKTVLGTLNQAGALQASKFQRVGLCIEGRFRWLNEALTEDLTLTLLERKNGIYPHERKILDFLVSHGIPKALLIKAYFENHELSQSGSSIPEWKELTRTFKAVFSPNFLQHLDEYVAKHGVEKTAAQLERDWQQI